MRREHGGAEQRLLGDRRIRIGQVVIPDLIIPSLWAGYDGAIYFFPIQISAGTRLSAFGNCLGAVYANVTLFDGAFTNGEGCAGVDSIGWASGSGTARRGI
ncbi:hypothetical protein [Bradyrhizobium sp. MOS002]|uniref:hypothetical protein n=1 Tax=Bradyrhizobium sp. MOS002 TaxID=2133947 RepID=UPI000D12BF1E|nr:hypothetical protein [Bradyrhizobium sp. MOS002]PSO19781.1 hypothetical protein C7G41_35300 [Bradyrhizobium sp. MOS002]